MAGMTRPRGKWTAILCGLAVLGILLAGAVYWRDLAAGHHLSRLYSDPDYLVVMLQASDGIVARTAIERFAESDVGKQALVGTYLGWVREWLEKIIPPSPFPGMKSGVFVVSGSSVQWYCEGAASSNSGSGSIDNFERMDLLQRLNEFLPLLTHKEVVLRDQSDHVISVLPMREVMERTGLTPGVLAVEEQTIGLLIEDRHVRLNPGERIFGQLDRIADLELMETIENRDGGSVAVVRNGKASGEAPVVVPAVDTLVVVGDSEEAINVATAPAGERESEAGQREPSGVSPASESLARRASQGDLSAMLALASEYAEGRNGEGDLFEAAKWWRRAADGGSVVAMRMLGSMYDFGYVEQPGLGQQRKRSPNPEEALKWYRKAADEGDTEAMRFIGLAYTFGGGVEKNASEAIRWFQRAAVKGNTAAMVSLGSVYSRSIPYDFADVQADFRVAATWYEKAARSGDPGGMYDLADLLYEGRPGLPADKTRAVGWMKQAQENGHRTAKEWLEARQ